MGWVVEISLTPKYLPTALFAWAIFVGVMPPDIFWAMLWPIEVKGVIWIPLAVEPPGIDEIMQVMTSFEPMGIWEPVASSI
jgi:hypothetical protein